MPAIIQKLYYLRFFRSDVGDVERYVVADSMSGPKGAMSIIPDGYEIHEARIARSVVLVVQS